ncbi:MAG TPA: hypothetical protein DDW85_02425 [Porphyromonadaceae bacterium]|nr:hypothetical protein [Porphyromonadaceae bacterium]
MSNMVDDKIFSFNEGYEEGLKEAFRWRDTRTEPIPLKADPYWIVVKSDNEAHLHLIEQEYDIDYMTAYYEKWKYVEIGDFVNQVNK